MEARVMKPELARRLGELRENGVQIDGQTVRYNFQQISDATGVSRSIISQYYNGQINLKPEVEQKLATWVNSLTARCVQQEGESETPAPATYKTQIELFLTNELREGMGLLEWTRKNRKMCVMIGYPGIGKTTTIREYARRVSGVHIIVCRTTMRMRNMIDAIAEALGITVSGSDDARIVRIQKELGGRPNEMLIFDEADHLYGWDTRKFEVLRQIWDETGTPIVLVGDLKLENLLTHGGSRQNLAQLYSRKYEMKFSGIQADEVRAILSDYNVEPSAVRELVAIATDVKHGGMRNFCEVFEMALAATEGGMVTTEVLAAATRYKLQG